MTDGVQLHSFCTDKYVEDVVLPTVEHGANRAGRSLRDVEITGGGFIVSDTPGKDLDAQVESLRQRIAFYASTRTYKPVMDVHGWGDVTLQLHRLSLQGQWKEMSALVTDEMIDAFAVIGPHDALPDLVRKRYGGWASSVTLSLSDAPDDNLKNLIEKIKRIP